MSFFQSELSLKTFKIFDVIMVFFLTVHIVDLSAKDVHGGLPYFTM